MIKILVIDDDLAINELIKVNLELAYYTVISATDGIKGFALAKQELPDLIILDVMMPEIDGFKLCRKMRHVTNVPILFLSGKVSEDDKIEGFEAGGDDYIEKPYSLREVYVRIVANIKRNTQRVSKKSSNMLIVIGDFVIDKEKHKLFYQNEEIIISNKEYELILFLAQNINREITFEEIGIKLWGTYIETDRRNVMVNVSRLRKKILDNTGVDNLIETVWSKGYKLVSH